MRSMTGFGVGQAVLGAGRLILELRSLNHRFLDVRVRLPSELACQSFYLEQRVREGQSRGRFDLGVRVEGAALPSATFSRDRARAVYATLVEMRDQLAPGSELPLSAVTALPELVTAPPNFDLDAVRGALETAFALAAAGLDEMREAEGKALRREIERQLDECRRSLTTIAERTQGLAETQRGRLRERVGRLLQGLSVELDPGRLEMELAIVADRSDISEEVARLDAHFTHFQASLGGTGALGRRLDFLLQEMAREANTVGAKCQDVAIAHLVVELKTGIERMREQVQNVE